MTTPLLHPAGGREAAQAVVLWTGGKDSALALWESHQQGLSVAELVTFAPAQAEFLAHPLPVMALQAQALALPHRIIQIEPPYEQSYRRAIVELRDRQGIGTLITGDIDLVGGLPNWVRQCCAGTGVAVHTPLWQRPRRALMDGLLAAGFEVVLSCVKGPWLSPAWLGRRLDRAALDELAQLGRSNGLDLCGENGEYHTLVLDGPLFRRRLRIGAFRPRLDGPMATMELGDVSLVDKETTPA